ncbi:MAG: hypothetical protein JW723_07985 [Bacteroidales bacterium]|nr:hypothetical protein [Bacteroidales bacterium]
MAVIIIFIGISFNTSGQQKVIPPPESDRTSTERSDFKFLARAELGLAHGQHQIDELTFTGLAIPIDIILGVTIFPKTYMHGSFGVTVMDRPIYTFDNIDYDMDGTLTMFDVGIGFTVYPLPQKIYASATIYGTTLVSFIGEEAYNSQIGAAFNLKGGIDFKLGSGFSVGFCAFLYYAGMKDQKDDFGYQAKINNLVIGMCLTTTLGNI